MSILCGLLSCVAHRSLKPAQLPWLLDAPPSHDAPAASWRTGLLAHTVGTLALGSSSEAVRQQACACLQLLHAACSGSPSQVWPLPWYAERLHTLQ